MEPPKATAKACVISCPSAESNSIEPKQKHASYGAKVPKPNCLPLAACRQLQWRTETSRQCLRRNDISATFRRATPLPASHDGGAAVFPPTPMADSTFRQSRWRVLISANACGGNSHVSSLGAPVRPEMANFFSGGHFRQ
jgi:hypothetical protein